MRPFVAKAKKLPKHLIKSAVHLPITIAHLATFIPFFGLLALLLITEPIRKICSFRPCAPISHRLGAPLLVVHDRLFNLLNRRSDGGMTSEDLILLAMSHLKVKKARSIITIGGMTIGFGSVIFLLSLGYGFQRLVISRVTTLGEMKQIDVTTSQASSLTFNSSIIDSFVSLEPVEAVLPVISTVSRVNFNNSVSDVVAYGVTTKFLESSAVQPIRGEIFENEEYVSDASSDQPLSEAAQPGKVAGASTSLVTGAHMGAEVSKVNYALFPLVWKPVYDKPSAKATLIGYTKRLAGQVSAVEVWGDVYADDQQSLQGVDGQNNRFNTWISDSFPLWEAKDCLLDNPQCADGKYMVLSGSSGQLARHGYITEDAVALHRYQDISVGNPELIENLPLKKVQFSFPSTEWVAVHEGAWQGASPSELFSKSDTTLQTFEGELVLGEYYFDSNGWGMAGEKSNGKKVGYWLKTTLPLWSKLDCGDDCNYYLTEQTDSHNQELRTVYVRAGDVHIVGMDVPPKDVPFLKQTGRVLGESVVVSDDSVSAASQSASSKSSGAGTSASASASQAVSSLDLSAYGITGVAGLSEEEWSKIASQAGIVQETQSKDVIHLPEKARKVALVNTAMLTLLGLQVSDALGKEFGSTFLLDGRLFGRENYSAESEPATYTIVGVLPDDKAPAFFVPLGDVKGLGVKNYSQLKIIADSTSFVAKIREEAEAKGFRTSSVVDTVESINQLFGYLRMGLLVLGLIALGVAALGMFNTLTVSLLEKTREVGLMKAMGMKSREVKRLFLAESVIMGVSGGVFGLLFGFIAGKLVSLLLTSISVANGSGPLDVAYIPWTLTVVIVVFSFVVGVATGWYPAHRATQVSALNALRYE